MFDDPLGLRPRHPEDQPKRRKSGKGNMSKSKATHSEKVRISIENDIFTGRLGPGSPIDEEAMAKRFSVSRTPVREAMLQLIETGLIEKKSRQRATVAKLDIRRLLQMFEGLSEIEGVCARLAARRATPAEKEALAQNHKLAEKALAAGKEEEYFRLGRRFHDLIIRSTHNNVLIELTNKLELPLVPYRRYQLIKGGRKTENQRDHEEIVAAILASDSDKAFELMRRHNTVQGDVLAEYISVGDSAVQS